MILTGDQLRVGMYVKWVLYHSGYKFHYAGPSPVRCFGECAGWWPDSARLVIDEVGGDVDSIFASCRYKVIFR